MTVNTTLTNQYKGIDKWIYENTKNDFRFWFCDRLLIDGKKILREVRRISFV